MINCIGGWYKHCYKSSKTGIENHHLIKRSKTGTENHHLIKRSKTVTEDHHLIKDGTKTCKRDQNHSISFVGWYK